jgi:hypothetical protein
MALFTFKWIDVDEATPREVFEGEVMAEDVIDAALIVLGELSLEGTRAEVFNMVEMS